MTSLFNKISKNIFSLTSLTTTLILSSCSYLPFSGIKNYKIEKMANILEQASEKNLAKIEYKTIKSSPTLKDTIRIISMDLNSLDDNDPNQKGTYEKNHPRLYNIFGVDQIKYIDAGKKGYSKEDTLITNVSCKHPKHNVFASFTLEDAYAYKKGIPTMNTKLEILCADKHGRIWGVKDKHTKKFTPPHEEYYRFIKQVESFVENKSN